MFRAGDEFLQTQFGNNNPYNQDDETTWLDWDRAQQHAEMEDQVGRLADALGSQAEAERIYTALPKPDGRAVRSLPP